MEHNYYIFRNILSHTALAANNGATANLYTFDYNCMKFNLAHYSGLESGFEAYSMTARTALALTHYFSG